MAEGPACRRGREGCVSVTSGPWGLRKRGGGWGPRKTPKFLAGVGGSPRKEGGDSLFGARFGR